MFAVITALAPHLIIMDEPTNHLESAAHACTLHAPLGPDHTPRKSSPRCSHFSSSFLCVRAPFSFVTIDALKSAISTFPGAILLVSHDQSLMEVCQDLWLMERKKPPKAQKVNPNQLKAAALKAQKEIAAAAKAAALKAKKAPASSAGSSSASSSKDEKLVFQSRCALRKLGMTFEEYRESLFASF